MSKLVTCRCIQRNITRMLTIWSKNQNFQFHCVHQFKALLYNTCIQISLSFQTIHFPFVSHIFTGFSNTEKIKWQISNAILYLHLSNKCRHIYQYRLLIKMRMHIQVHNTRKMLPFSLNSYLVHFPLFLSLFLCLSLFLSVCTNKSVSSIYYIISS